MSTNAVLMVSNRVNRIQRFMNSSGEPVHWIVVGESGDSHRAAVYLRSHPQAQELDSGELFRHRRNEFRRKYIQFIGDLNQRNNSLTWWGLPPSSKDPNTSSLAWDVAAFLLVVDLVREGYRQFVVVADSPHLAAQVKAWAHSEKVEASCSVKVSGGWKAWLKRYTPAPVAKGFLATTGRWLLSRKLASGFQARDGHLAVVSLTYPTSFKGDGNRDGNEEGYQDTYFGPLVDHLETSGAKALVIAVVRGSFRFQFDKLQSLDRKVPVVPIEGFLTMGDIFSSALNALWRFIGAIDVKGDLKIDGKDVAVLVRRSFTEACRSGSPFLHSWFHRAGLRIAHAAKVERMVYPYENRPWEKMLVLAARKVSPQARIVGYQHAAITPSHLHFFLGEGEAQVTPLPDLILTTGPFVRDWLASEGAYPAGVIQEGCALRFQGRNGTAAKARTGVNGKRVLVVLGHPQLEDYAKTLLLVGQAVDSKSGWEVVIRPHPRNPESAQTVLRSAAFTGSSLPSLSTGDLSQELERSGVVVYASSTVGLEAASLGIPTICLDPGKALDMDPMGSWSEFKWSVANAQEFRWALEQIEQLSQDKLDQGSRRAMAFSSDYLKPVTDEGVRLFLAA